MHQPTGHGTTSPRSDTGANPAGADPSGIRTATPSSPRSIRSG